jgi:hypothetical protein
MNPLSLQQRLYGSLKWFLLFVLALAYFKPRVGGDAPGTALAFLVCIPLYYAIYRILYGCAEELFEGIGYIFTPDLLSLAFGQYLDDLFKSYKVMIWVALCVLSGMRVDSYYGQAYQLISHS